MKWNIDMDKPNELNGELTQLERAFITDGFMGTYSEKDREKLVDNISEKANKLPDRFENLIKDITLFHKFGRLDLEPEGDFPNSALSDLYTPGQHASEYQDIPNSLIARENHEATRFGVELGAAMRLIFEANDCTNEFRDFLWGLLVAELEASTPDGDSMRDALFDIIQQFEEYHHQRITGDLYTTDVDAIDKKWQRKRRRKARKSLTEANLRPSNELVDILISQARPPDQLKVTREALEASLDGKVTVLRLTQYLCRTLEADMDYLSNQRLVGIPAEELFKTLWDRIDLVNLDTNVEIQHFQSEFDTSQRAVTRALRQLYNDYGLGEGPKYEVTKELSDGVWGLTGYGRTLALQKFEQSSYEWMYKQIYSSYTIKPIQDDSSANHITELVSKPNSDPSELFGYRFRKKACLQEAALEIIASETNTELDPLLEREFDSVIDDNREQIQELH